MLQINPPSPLFKGGLGKHLENLVINPTRWCSFSKLVPVLVALWKFTNINPPFPLLQGGLSYKLENMVIQKKIKCKFSKLVLYFVPWWKLPNDLLHGSPPFSKGVRGI